MGDFPVLDGQLFLFQGDSITDCGRRAASAPFGGGYPSIFIERMTAAFPERKVRYINKGISGDRVTGLRDRWEDDVIRHQPDWVSILIGINDLHGFLRDPANGVSVETYRERGVASDEEIRAAEEQLSGVCTVEIAAFNEFTRLRRGQRDLSHLPRRARPHPLVVPRPQPDPGA